MFQRIVVPLDGSERAEHALAVAARLARATGGSIVLLQIVEPQTEYDMYPVQPTLVTAEEVEDNIKKARGYLTSLLKREELEGIGGQIEVRAGAVAPTLCSFAQSTAADVIVMCSHGYTGLKRWLLGSVADVVARTAPVPVLILREGGPMLTDVFQDGRSARALVTLDGSPLAEAALEPAAQLVAALATPAQGALHLVRVVDFPDFYGHGKSQANISMEMIEQGKQVAKAYLTSLMEQLQKGSAAHLNLSLTASVVSNRDVASAIIQTSESTEGGYALLAMSTHGRSGWKRWVIGSIAERVLHNTKLPICIIRPQERATKKEGTQASAVSTEQSEEQNWVGLR